MSEIQPVSTYKQNGKVLAAAHDYASDLMVSSSTDGSIHVGKPLTGEFVRFLEGRKPGECRKHGVVLCISTSSPSLGKERSIACGTSTGDVELYNTETGRLVRRFKGLECGSVLTVRISESGRILVFGGQGVNATGYAKIWDMSACRVVKEIKAHGMAVHDVVISTNDAWIMTCGFGSDIKSWDLITGRMLNSFPLRIAGKNPLVPEFDKRTKEMMRDNFPELLDSIESSSHGVQSISTIHLGAAGFCVACLENDRSVIINERDQRLSTITGAVATISGFRPDKVATGTSKGEIMGWELGTAERLFTIHGHEQPICTMTLLRRNQVVTGDDGGMLHMWNLPFPQTAQEFFGF